MVTSTYEVLGKFKGLCNETLRRKIKFRVSLKYFVELNYAISWTYIEKKTDHKRPSFKM